MMFSQSYIKQLKQLHNDKSRPEGFGGKVKGLGKFKKFMEEWNPSSCLDYGCGKGVILETFKTNYPDCEFEGYDPAVEEYSALPQKRYELLFSNDVLEHIEPAYIDHVMKHINSLSSRYLWLRIDTAPARKKLPDGRNAHILLKDAVWWERKIQDHIQGNIIFDELNDKGKLDFAIEKWYSE